MYEGHSTLNELRYNMRKRRDFGLVVTVSRSYHVECLRGVTEKTGGPPRAVGNVCDENGRRDGTDGDQGLPGNIPGRLRGTDKGGRIDSHGVVF